MKHARHTINTTYAFKWDQVELEGSLVSPASHFGVLPGNTPDELAAQLDPNLIALVEAAVTIDTGCEGCNVTYSHPLGNGKFKPIGKWVIPAVKLTEPLPLGLVMKPEILLEGRETPLTRVPWIVPAGETSTQVLENSVGDPQLATILREAKTPEGRLKAKLILRPSRADALAHIAIENYYSQPIERDVEFRWSKSDETAPNNK